MDTIEILPGRFVFGQGAPTGLVVEVDGEKIEIPIGKRLQVSSRIKTLLKEDKIHTSVVEQIPGNRIKIVRKK